MGIRHNPIKPAKSKHLIHAIVAEGTPLSFSLFKNDAIAIVGKLVANKIIIKSS